MHLPQHNAELRVPVLQQFIRENPLGILTTAIRNVSLPFLQSSHIPWVIDTECTGKEGCGKLRGHVARQNPQAKAIIEAVSKAPADHAYILEDVLILFNGPIHHYVTPKFYKETKPANGKVVPTWDYEAVEVYGKAKVYVDTRSEAFDDFLTRQLSDLSKHAESSIMGYGKGEKASMRPWNVSDAPVRYIDLLKKNLIGIEIEIATIAGRFKMSQEKKRGDRDGVIDGFRGLQNPIGSRMSEMVSNRATEYDSRQG